MTEAEILLLLPSVFSILESRKEKILAEYKTFEEDEDIDPKKLWSLLVDSKSWFVADVHELPIPELVMVVDDLQAIPDWCCGMTYVCVPPSQLKGNEIVKTWVFESKHEEVDEGFDLVVWTADDAIVAWDFR